MIAIIFDIIGLILLIFLYFILRAYRKELSRLQKDYEDKCSELDNVGLNICREEIAKTEAEINVLKKAQQSDDTLLKLLYILSVESALVPAKELKSWTESENFYKLDLLDLDKASTILEEHSKDLAKHSNIEVVEAIISIILLRSK